MDERTSGWALQWDALMFKLNMPLPGREGTRPARAEWQARHDKGRTGGQSRKRPRTCQGRTRALACSVVIEPDQ